MKHLLLPGLLCAVFLVSCHSSTETTLNGGVGSSGGTVGLWTIPDLGTIYVYETTPGVEFDTDVILKSGQHLGGKTNVVTYIEHFATGGFDSEYYNIETNGDFSIGAKSGTFDSSGNPEFSWQTYPTSSHQPINVITPIDSTTANGSHIVQSEVRTFVGVENLTIPAGTFSTLHVRQAYTDIDSTPSAFGASFSEFANADFWFTPSIGFYIQTSDQSTVNGQQEEESGVTLIQYIPR